MPVRRLSQESCRLISDWTRSWSRSIGRIWQSWTCWERRRCRRLSWNIMLMSWSNRLRKMNRSLRGWSRPKASSSNLTRKRHKVTLNSSKKKKNSKTQSKNYRLSCSRLQKCWKIFKKHLRNKSRWEINTSPKLIDTQTKSIKVKIKLTNTRLSLINIKPKSSNTRQK